MNSADLPKLAPRPHHTRSVRDVLMARFQYEAALSAPPSASGGQLEALRLGMSGQDDSRIYRATQGADRKAVALADALLLTKDLTAAEVDLLRLRYWIPLDGHEEYTKNVPEADIHTVEIGEAHETWREQGTPRHRAAMLPVRMTLDGEEAIPHKALGEDEQEGRAVIRGVRAKMTSYETIAARMGSTPATIRRQIQAANEKIKQRLVMVRERNAAETK